MKLGGAGEGVSPRPTSEEGVQAADRLPAGNRGHLTLMRAAEDARQPRYAVALTDAPTGTAGRRARSSANRATSARTAAV